MRDPVARARPLAQGHRRRDPARRLHRARALPRPVRAGQPDGRGVPAQPGAERGAPVRHHRARPGRLRPGGLRHQAGARDRVRRRPGVHADRRAHRRRRRLPRRLLGRRAQPVHRRGAGDPAVPAADRDRRLRAQLGHRRADRGAHLHRLVLHRPPAPLPGAVAAQPGLPRRRPGARRARGLHHRGGDPAHDDLAARRGVPHQRALRRAVRLQPAVRRPRRPELGLLGHDALLGGEQRGAADRLLPAGDRARRGHRAARRGVRAAQLRVRRDRQPGAAPGARAAGRGRTGLAFRLRIRRPDRSA